MNLARAVRISGERGQEGRHLAPPQQGDGTRQDQLLGVYTALRGAGALRGFGSVTCALLPAAAFREVMESARAHSYAPKKEVTSHFLGIIIAGIPPESTEEPQESIHRLMRV